jgi:iron complex transport system ATP-binding protein
MSLLSLKSIAIMRGNKTLLKPFELEIQANQVWGILGANGAGKTTLLHSMINLHPIHSGTVQYSNEDVKHHSQRWLARKMGLMLQNIEIHFSQTVEEILLTARYPASGLNFFYNQADIQIIKTVLKQLDLEKFRHRNIGQLSGGEQKRVMFAKLWIQNPRIYLLDEPTNHLDMKFQSRLLSETIKQAQKKSGAVLMSIHDANIALQYCDYSLLILPDGSVLTGQTSEILTVDNLQKVYGCPFIQLKDGDQQAFISGTEQFAEPNFN